VYDLQYEGVFKRLSLSPGLNFISVLCTVFMRADPKSVKKTVKLSIFFTLSGSMSVKAVVRTLMKLTPDDFFLSLEDLFKKCQREKSVCEKK